MGPIGQWSALPCSKMLALVLSLVVAQDASKPISISLRACSAKRALVAITEKTGIPLTVQPRIADEIIKVDVDKMPTAKLLDKIAYVLHAKVELSGSGYVITRPKEMQLALEEAEIGARAAALQKQLDKKGKELGSAANPTARAEAVIKAIQKQEDYVKETREKGHIPGLNLDDVRREAPAGRLNAQLAILIGARAAASLHRYEQAIYSNRPVPGQRPLPPEASSLIAEYVETEQHLATMLDDSIVSGEAGRNYTDMMSSAQMTDGVGKIRFSVRRRGPVISCAIWVFTKSGKLRSSAYLNNVTMGEKLARDKALSLPQGKPKLVALSPLRAEFEQLAPEEPVGMWNPRAIKLSDRKMSPELRKAIGSPTEVDPLEILGGATLQSLAESKSAGLVACLPDLLTMCERNAVKGGQVDLGRFEAGLEPVCGLESENQDGLLVCRPTSPIAVEEDRVSRKALEGYLNSLFVSGREHLYPVARFHLDGGWAVISNPIIRAEQILLDKQGYTRMPEYGQLGHELLCLLGTLSPKLLEERQVNLESSTLPGEGRRWLMEWLLSQELSGKTVASMPDLDHLAQEAFRGEIPPGGLSLEFQRLPAAQLDYTNIPEWQGRFLDPAGLAKQFAYLTKMSKWQFTAEQLDKSNYFMGEMERHKIGFFVEPELYVKASVEAGRTKEGKSIPYSSLPADFRDEVKRLYDVERGKSGG